MNYTLVLKLISNLLRAEAAFMLVPFVVSIAYGGQDMTAFLWSILITAAVSLALSFIKPKDKAFKTRDAFAAVAVSWLAVSLFGALPFYFSGCFGSVVDCVFESISGFTTTGATILRDIEGLPHGILFWRSFTHWIGGMGVLVFMLAVMPSMNASSINLLRAESSGPSPGRIVPRIRETARIMYLIYLAMTVVLVAALIITGLPVYDAFIHSFSTAGTGGFSNMNASVGAYGNVAAEVVITVFTFLFGVSFTLYFCLIKRNFKQAYKDQELRLYFGIVVVSIMIITFNILKMYGSFAEALRQSSFQVVTIISTTGFSTASTNTWPALSQIILILLMVTGCCAGSTGGGIKLIRVLLLLKGVRNEINKVIHPKSVKAISINDKKVDNEKMAGMAMFVVIYLAIFTVSTLIISIEGRDIVTSFTTAISALSNIGPYFDPVSHIGDYAAFTPLSKIVLSFCMLAGRLEFLPVLILFRPSVWARGKTRKMEA